MIIHAGNPSDALVLLALSAETEPAPDRLTNKLRSFATLREGWNFGDGLPVAISAIETAEEILRWASQLQLRADVFPGIDGECMVAFYGGDRCVRVIVHPDRSLGLRVEQGIGFAFDNVVAPRDGVTRQEVFSHVRDLIDTAWSTFASSASGSMIERASGSLTMPLRTPAQSTGEASQL